MSVDNGVDQTRRLWHSQLGLDGHSPCPTRRECEAFNTGYAAAKAEPIPMILFCPNCGRQHIDKPEPSQGWDNPPHKSHKCWSCLHIWRPADVFTVGVEEITTRGTRDSPLVIRGCFCPDY